MPDFKPQYLVIHTAASRQRDCDRDLIDQWHRERGWDGIGYHYVIINDQHSTLADGTVQVGRNVGIPGAHVRGLNSRSLGICCVGHGDHEPFTAAQEESLVKLVSKLIDEHEEITLAHVIGHREINRLVGEGILSSSHRTSKSCPGDLVSMDSIRTAIRTFRETPPVVEVTGDEAEEQEVREALDILERAPAGVFPNARAELRGFLSHPEVVDFRA